MAQKKKKRKKNKGTKDGLHQYPNEAFVQIFIRLPIQAVLRCGCVCKSWHNLIHHDPYFTTAYCLQSQKNPVLNISYTYILKDQKKFSLFYFTDELLKILRTEKFSVDYWKVPCYCNGLICLTYDKIIKVCNYSRYEAFIAYTPVIRDCRTDCYGFGFDSSSNNYKVVYILKRAESADGQFKCMVFTLGANTWGEIIIQAPIPFFEVLSKSAIFCSGALYWRTGKQLISLDLHEEKFQVIQMPVECIATEQQYVHHLEFKGSICIAHLECPLGSDGNCKVQIYRLKNKIQQVWMKETFLFPHCYNVCNTTTWLVSFSDRILIGWFDEEYHLRDLHMKYNVAVDFPGTVKPTDDNFYRMDCQLNNHVENFMSVRTLMPEGAHRISISDDVRPILKQLRKHGGFSYSSLHGHKIQMIEYSYVH